MTMAPVDVFRECKQLQNLVGGDAVPGTGATLSVESPYDSSTIGELRRSTAADVDHAVRTAHDAFQGWQKLPLRERVEPLLSLRRLLLENLDLLSRTAAVESGKTPGEARAGVLRGIEVIDFAASLPNADQGGAMYVSRGVSCEYRRDPLGVTVGITPFNFPAMVPLWMLPIALTVGNAFVLKPSEKVPLSASLMGELAGLAGYPPGVVSVIHGDRTTVEALVDHPLTRAVAFVGSSPVAESVYRRATHLGKRALCLGGAKNQLIVAPDADPELTVKAVVDSFTGCAGQRCMATSLMIAVGDGARLIDAVRTRAAALRVGRDMGALIDAGAKNRIETALDRAVEEGAELALDGREPAVPDPYLGGHWLGPCLLDHVEASMECVRTELFGPVLTVLRVDTLEEALAIERANPYGNATSVFTSSGAVARHVADQATSAMVGVNVGVPVPRDPFSFGGRKQSRFGHGDVTGPAGVDFWSDHKKITTKWSVQKDATWMS